MQKLSEAQELAGEIRGRVKEYVDARLVFEVTESQTHSVFLSVAGNQLNAAIDKLTAMAEVNCIDQLREENQHLRKLLEHISLSDQGGEIFPSGPSEYVYADDGNTLIDVKGPWCFCGGRGSTFIEAVDGSMKKDGAKEMPQPDMAEVKND